MKTDSADIAGQGFFLPEGTGKHVRAAGGTVSTNAGAPWFHIPVGGPAEADRIAWTPVRTIRLLLLLLPLAVPAGASAQERIGGPPPPVVCVKVDIAGERAGHLECAAAQLQEAARLAQTQARAALETSVVGAGSPDIRTGVASQTATRQRLGSSFGHSVIPQRPNRPPPPTRPGHP